MSRSFSISSKLSCCGRSDKLVDTTVVPPVTMEAAEEVDIAEIDWERELVVKLAIVVPVVTIYEDEAEIEDEVEVRDEEPTLGTRVIGVVELCEIAVEGV